MLGLTTPDAIAFGSLCAAFLAAFAGMVGGERVRRKVLVPTELQEALITLTAALTELAAAIRSAKSADTTRDQYTDMIHVLRRSLDDRENSIKR